MSLPAIVWTVGLSVVLVFVSGYGSCYAQTTIEKRSSVYRTVEVTDETDLVFLTVDSDLASDVLIEVNGVNIAEGQLPPEFVDQMEFEGPGLLGAVPQSPVLSIKYENNGAVYLLMNIARPVDDYRVIDISLYGERLVVELRDEIMFWDVDGMYGQKVPAE